MISDILLEIRVTIVLWHFREITGICLYFGFFAKLKCIFELRDLVTRTHLWSLLLRNKNSKSKQKMEKCQIQF